MLNELGYKMSKKAEAFFVSSCSNQPMDFHNRSVLSR